MRIKSVTLYKIPGSNNLKPSITIRYASGASRTYSHMTEDAEAFIMREDVRAHETEFLISYRVG